MALVPRFPSRGRQHNISKKCRLDEQDATVHGGKLHRHIVLTQSIVQGCFAIRALFSFSNDQGTRHEKEARSIDADGAVIVMPGSQWATKAWPEGQFSSLLDQTTERIVLLGSQKEHPLCARLAEGRPHVTNRAGEVSLLGMAAAIGMAKAVVANDSVPLHVASAMNTPTIALFTSTVPSRNENGLQDNVVYHDFRMADKGARLLVQPPHSPPRVDQNQTWELCL